MCSKFLDLAGITINPHKDFLFEVSTCETESLVQKTPSEKKTTQNKKLIKIKKLSNGKF